MPIRKLILPLAVSAAMSPAIAQDVVEETVVYGQRGMIASAIDRQRDADNIKSILTSDAIGNFVDQNVAESLRRLPGINVLNDQGEGRFVSVRGLDPSLNSASVNGTRIPSPEADTRAVALDVIPSDLVESIEVSKTLTPDMDADTIGAAINIKTNKAFDRDADYAKAQVISSYNDLNEEYSPEYGFDFSQKLNDRLGIAGGVKYSKRKTSTDNLEMDGWGETDDGIVFADAVEYRDYDVERERTGISFTVDYKLSEQTELFARALYSQFDDLELRRRLVFEMDEDPSSGDANTAFFDSADGEISVRRGIKDRFETQDIQTFEFGGTTNTSDWNFDYKISFASASEHEYKTQDPTRFRNDFDEAGQLGVSFDYTNLDFTPYTITQDGAGFNEAATYEVNKVELVDGKTEDEEMAISFDAARSFDFSAGEMTLKAGLKLRQREKTNDIYLQVLEDFDGDYTLADVLGTQSYGLIDMGPTPDLGAVRAFNNANLSGFEENTFDTDFESNAEDFAVEEDIFAFYAMGRYETDRMVLIGGVRVEQTDNDVRGNLTEVVEEGGVRDGVTLDDDTLFISDIAIEQSYTDILPSLSLKYSLTDDMILRGGIFKSVVRPNIGQLAPIFIVEEADDGERQGEFGNPDLDPYEAWNFDLSLEHYFTDSAVVQAGVFYKEVENFIVTAEFEADDAPFNGVYNSVAFDEAEIPLNGDTATIQGFEFAYSQAFDSGLVLGLNYTYTDTEGDFYGRPIALPAAAETTYNALIGYERDRLSARLTVAYRDMYLDEVNGDPEEDRFVKDHTQVDFTTDYEVTDGVSVFLKLINLTDEPYIAYQAGPGRDRLLQYEEYSWTGKLGIRVRF